jgi:hypothetical protein
MSTSDWNESPSGAFWSKSPTDKKADMSLVWFQPGSCIDIGDVMTGIRKLGEVTLGGQMYVDLDVPEPCPFPIYKALDPVSIGCVTEWAALACVRGKADAYREIDRRLREDRIDRLTALRALYLATMLRDYHYDHALLAAQKETALVVESREKMHRLCRKGDI